MPGLCRAGAVSAGFGRIARARIPEHGWPFRFLASALPGPAARAVARAGATAPARAAPANSRRSAPRAASPRFPGAVKGAPRLSFRHRRLGSEDADLHAPEKHAIVSPLRCSRTERGAPNSEDPEKSKRFDRGKKKRHNLASVLNAANKTLTATFFKN